MRTLLRIDASIRAEGSHSRALGDHFEKRWLEAHPEGRVMRRDLAREPVPHLNAVTLAAFMGQLVADGETVSSMALSEELISELESADEVLVSTPVYNFGTPSALKAWADHVIRAGRTFTMDEKGFHGLLSGKSAWILTARGGVGPLWPDFQGPLLHSVFRILGFDRVQWTALEGTMLGPVQLEQAMTRAWADVEVWFQPGPPADGIEWRGLFTAQDRAEIAALREGQVRAILKGDAAAYARLVTDDIVLMLQGREMVTGREAFLRCETDLLAGTRFITLQQNPLRIERDGVLAVETGSQESGVEAGGAETGHYQARRKYTHVLRKTEDGWRFAVLMSNNSQ
ncbi:SgcJ/EcaC family oxidoreductase [Prosthecobacter sp. SYSU 5D2]|uniref:SgcJ/EcaC family oxidoreductase n=1 Tax=Prosthecobacter sp. SYSU 5D2 TaxID=3134134 RepID=UPI0031FF1BCB